MISDFPLSFSSLAALYSGFEGGFEYNRQSFPDWWQPHLIKASLKDFQTNLNSGSEQGEELRAELMQRFFYRSAASFYRSFDLFLTYLMLQRYQFATWSQVTGYYSRFYFIQAFLNLLQAGWFDGKDSIPADGMTKPSTRNLFAFNSGTHIILLSDKELRSALGKNPLGSHQIWWEIYEGLNELKDFPQFPSLQFVLGDYYFTPEQRNAANYSFKYLVGFNELDLFDSSTESMMTHFNFHERRNDRDITSIDRFFGGVNPADADEGDFYGDEAQMLWSSVDCYLRLLKALGVRQSFITVDKLDALTRVHIANVLPKLTAGIILEINECLN